MHGFGSAGTVRIAAPAKINLALHVVGRRTDGYHLLDGIAVFTELGDRLSFLRSDQDRLRIGGPFGDLIPTGGDNLVLRALRAVRTADATLLPVEIKLTKRLPPAAGIGGGSADAAAVLAWAAAHAPSLGAQLRTIAVSLGADVPMCLASRPLRTRGIGEELDPLVLPNLPVVLANPGVTVSTPTIFAALERRENTPLPPLPAVGLGRVEDVVSFLSRCRNDLEEPAMRLEPVIADVRQALDRAGSSLTRMSGSGATVFGLFSDQASANRAAAALRAMHPRWWVVATQTVPARPVEMDDDDDLDA